MFETIWKLLVDDEFIKNNIYEIKGFLVFSLTLVMWTCHWLLICLCFGISPLDVFCKGETTICLKPEVALLGLVIIFDLIFLGGGSRGNLISTISRNEEDTPLIIKYYFCFLNRCCFFTILILPILVFLLQLSDGEGIFGTIGTFLIIGIFLWFILRGFLCFYLTARALDNL